MPRYIYKCKECDKEFEIFHKMAECDKEFRCEECNSIMKRVISPVGVILKGSGFHVNDYNKYGRKK